jgi:hypothetical protein
MYLTTTLSDEPATPPDLAAAVRKLAELYQELTVRYLKGVDEAELESRRHAADDTVTSIERLCK